MEMPIGYLYEGRKVFCFACKPSDPNDDTLCALFLINIRPYWQSCHSCGNVLVEANGMGWSEFFPKADLSNEAKRAMVQNDVSDAHKWEIERLSTHGAKLKSNPLPRMPTSEEQASVYSAAVAPIIRAGGTAFDSFDAGLNAVAEFSYECGLASAKKRSKDG